MARLRLICSVGCLVIGNLTSKLFLHCFVSIFPDLAVYGSLPLWGSTLRAAGLGLPVGGLDGHHLAVPDRLPLMRDPVGPSSREASVFLLRCRLQAWLVP